MKTTQTKLIKSSSIPASLIRAVIRQMGGWETFTNYAPDITRHGINAGFLGFTYYHETEPFAARNKNAILELASSQAQEIGYDSTLAMIRSFGCFRDEKITDCDLMRALCKGQNPKNGPNILNGLAWYAAEEVARAYCDLIEA